MKEPTPEQARQAWEERAEYQFANFADRNIFIAGIEAYQESLRKEIEKEIEEVRSSNSYSPTYAEGKINGLRLAIQSLSTVTPIEK